MKPLPSLLGTTSSAWTAGPRLARAAAHGAGDEAVAFFFGDEGLGVARRATAGEAGVPASARAPAHVAVGGGLRLRLAAGGGRATGDAADRADERAGADDEAATDEGGPLHGMRWSRRDVGRT